MARNQLTFTVTDSTGKSGNFSYWVKESLTDTELEDYATAIEALIDPVIDGSVTRIGVSKTIFSSSAAPLANTDIEVGAFFSIGVVDSPKIAGLSLPTFDVDLINSLSNAIDYVTPGAVKDLVDALKDGVDIAGNIISWKDSEGRGWGTVLKAYQTFKRTRKAR